MFFIRNEVWEKACVFIRAHAEYKLVGHGELFKIKAFSPPPILVRLYWHSWDAQLLRKDLNIFRVRFIIQRFWFKYKYSPFNLTGFFFFFVEEVQQHLIHVMVLLIFNWLFKLMIKKDFDMKGLRILGRRDLKHVILFDL